MTRHRTTRPNAQLTMLLPVVVFVLIAAAGQRVRAGELLNHLKRSNLAGNKGNDVAKLPFPSTSASHFPVAASDNDNNAVAVLPPSPLLARRQQQHSLGKAAVGGGAGGRDLILAGQQSPVTASAAEQAAGIAMLGATKATEADRKAPIERNIVALTSAKESKQRDETLRGYEVAGPSLGGGDGGGGGGGGGVSGVSSKTHIIVEPRVSPRKRITDYDSNVPPQMIAVYHHHRRRSIPQGHHRHHHHDAQV